MHFNGWVFGHEVDQLMNSLTHRDGDSPAEVWLPIEDAGAIAHDELGWRSGWALIHAWENDPRAEPVEEWAEFYWPTTFLRERLGPHALLPDAPLGWAAVARRNIRRIDGAWHAAVPRFYRTVCDYWSPLRARTREALVTTSGGQRHKSTVAQIDLEASLELGGPSLIVGPEGPVFYDVSFRDDPTTPSRRRSAAEGLMRLPGDTPVTGVDFHG
jgi:hypothetical protein